MDQYLIIFTGKVDDDWLVEDDFYKLLKVNQSSLGFSSINHYYSDLTNLAFSYALDRLGMLEHLNEKFTYKVIKLTFPERELKVNHEIDALFRKCVATFEEPINSSLFYLIEKNGEADFHRISRSIIDGVMDDDDHMNMNGILTNHPDLFFRHFYNHPYTKKQIAEIAKMTLVVGSPEEVV